jgi:CubicO group peptidase (beta-lactamase class C family)
MRRLVPLLPLLLVLSLSVPAIAARRRVVTPTAPLVLPAAEAIAADALKNFPGVIIAVRRGNAFYTNAWGDLDIEANVPMRTDAQIWVASISKQFTAAAILRLSEEGKIGIDDPVRRFIPELDGRFEPITVRHLLNHTSGITEYLSHVGSKYEPVSQQEIVAAIMSRPPDFPAGSRWDYSNSGYYLLGMIIERTSNKTYEQYVRETFLEPLQLTETSYCGIRGPVPQGYSAAGGRFTELQPYDVSMMYAAGGLCSTARDLLSWNRALLNGTAISPQSYEAMIGETVDAYVFAKYGFGLYVDSLSSHRRIWHNGMIPGFQSHLAYFPDDDLTVVVLVNGYTIKDRAVEVGEAVARAMLQ